MKSREEAGACVCMCVCVCAHVLISVSFQRAGPSRRAPSSHAQASAFLPLGLGVITDSDFHPNSFLYSHFHLKKKKMLADCSRDQIAERA